VGGKYWYWQASSLLGEHRDSLGRRTGTTPWFSCEMLWGLPGSEGECLKPAYASADLRLMSPVGW